MTFIKSSLIFILLPIIGTKSFERSEANGNHLSIYCGSPSVADIACIPSIFIKTSQKKFWWKIWQIVFFFFCPLAFESILFWLGCDDWKMDDLFQCPLGPTSIIFNLYFFKQSVNLFLAKYKTDLISVNHSYWMSLVNTLLNK